MKAYRFLFLFLPMIVIEVAAAQQQSPSMLPLSPFSMFSTNVPARGEYIYEERVTMEQEELNEVAQRGHNLLFGDKNVLQCFIFREDCLDREQNALEVIYDFLSTPKIADELDTKENRKQRIATAGEALREYYEIAHQFASISNTMQNLLLQGYRESNWMDRQLKNEVNKILGGYDTVTKNERLMKYLTHFYFGSPPTKERIEMMKALLNPNILPRRTNFQKFRSALWGAVTAIPRGIKYLYQQDQFVDGEDGESTEVETLQ